MDECKGWLTPLLGRMQRPVQTCTLERKAVQRPRSSSTFPTCIAISLRRLCSKVVVKLQRSRFCVYFCFLTGQSFFSLTMFFSPAGETFEKRKPKESRGWSGFVDCLPARATGSYYDRGEIFFYRNQSSAEKCTILHRRHKQFLLISCSMTAQTLCSTFQHKT